MARRAARGAARAEWPVEAGTRTGGTVKHATHIRHAAHVPRGKIAIEGSGTAKHVGHIRQMLNQCVAAHRQDATGVTGEGEVHQAAHGCGWMTMDTRTLWRRGTTNRAPQVMLGIIG